MDPRSTGLPAALAFGLSFGAAFALPATAFADPATAAASVGNFAYTLIDLTPDDGRTPWVTLGPRQASEITEIHVNTFLTSKAAAENDRFDYGTRQVQLGQDWASGTTRPLQANAAISISDRSGGATTRDEYSFRLSPNTRLVLTAYATADVTMSRSTNAATAYAGIFGEQYGLPYPQDGDFGDTVGLYARPGSKAHGVEVDIDSGAGGTDGYFDLIASVAAGNMALPVPEPGQAWMLLAGLPLLARAWRRR